MNDGGRPNLKVLFPVFRVNSHSLFMILYVMTDQSNIIRCLTVERVIDQSSFILEVSIIEMALS